MGELDETDNAYGSITVTVTEEGMPPPEPPVSTTVGSIAGETWISLSGLPMPHGRTDVYVYQGDTLVAFTTSGEDTMYEFPDLPIGTYTVIGETWLDGVRYSNSYEVDVLENETTVCLIVMYPS